MDQKRFKMEYDSVTKVNFKEIATAMSVQMLKYLYRKASNEHAKIIVQWARTKGADIPDDQIQACADELSEALPEPTNWPQLEFNTTTGQAAVNAKAPASRSKKSKADDDSDKASSLSAKDFGELKVPEGTVVECPAEIKSGARKGGSCGKQCTRVLNAHDPEDPKCASFKCDHMYCGTHIVKAGKMDSTLAAGRLEGKKETKAKPVVTDKSGKTSTVDTKLLGELKTDAQSNASAATMAKLLGRIASTKPAANPE